MALANPHMIVLFDTRFPSKASNKFPYNFLSPAVSLSYAKMNDFSVIMSHSASSGEVILFPYTPTTYASPLRPFDSIFKSYNDNESEFLTGVSFYTKQNEDNHIPINDQNDHIHINDHFNINDQNDHQNDQNQNQINNLNINLNNMNNQEDLDGILLQYESGTIISFQFENCPPSRHFFSHFIRKEDEAPRDSFKFHPKFESIASTNLREQTPDEVNWKAFPEIQEKPPNGLLYNPPPPPPQDEYADGYLMDIEGALDFDRNTTDEALRLFWESHLRIVRAAMESQGN